DEEWNNENVNILSEEIEVMLKSHGVCMKRAEIVDFLEELRKCHCNEKLTEQDRISALENIDYAAEKFYHSLKWEFEADKAIAGSALGAGEGAMITLTESLASKTNWLVMG